MTSPRNRGDVIHSPTAIFWKSTMISNAETSSANSLIYKVVAILASLLGLFALSAGMFVFGVRASQAQTASNAGSAPPTLSLAAQAIGIKRCFAAIDATARRATKGATRQDILIDWYRLSPDGGPSFSMTGMEFNNNPVVLSLAAMPTGNNQCTVFAEQISSTDLACGSFASSQLPGYQANSLLPSISVYVHPNRATETISLVSAKTGCLIIRRQATFDWGK